MKEYFAVLALALAGCAQSIEPAPLAGEVYHLPEIDLHIVNRPELERVYREAGRTLGPGDKLHGFAGVDASGRAVIYSLPPTRVDDAPTLTIGHELLHVALGEYHGSAR